MFAHNLPLRRHPSLGAILTAALLLGGAGSLQASHAGTPAPGAGNGKWAYTGERGPEHWAELSTGFATCREGKAQSPIDIRGARPDFGEPLLFRYRSNSLTLVNDGRTIRVDYEPGSYIRLGQRRYELIETDFHVPGEHRVNGVAADMVAHFLHQDSDGNLAIVEVPFIAGRRSNNMLARIWENLPERPGATYSGRQVGINPTFLLPNDRSYYAYLGSLATPPCSEGVQWFVFREPVEVDASYIRRLLDLVGPNARPVQPLNGRPISLQSR